MKRKQSPLEGSAKRQKDFITRQKALGFVKRSFMIHKSKVEEVRAMIAELNESLGGSKETDSSMCKCGAGHSTPLHACPFQQDIKGNNDPLFCRCCDECRHQCAMDI